MRPVKRMIAVDAGTYRSRTGEEAGKSATSTTAYLITASSTHSATCATLARTHVEPILHRIITQRLYGWLRSRGARIRLRYWPSSGWPLQVAQRGFCNPRHGPECRSGDRRRRPDLNRRWGFCRPLPYHLATSPRCQGLNVKFACMANWLNCVGLTVQHPSSRQPNCQTARPSRAHMHAHPSSA